MEENQRGMQQQIVTAGCGWLEGPEGGRRGGWGVRRVSSMGLVFFNQKKKSVFLASVTSARDNELIRLISQVQSHTVVIQKKYD